MKVGGISLSTPKLSMPINLHCRSKSAATHRMPLMVEAGESSDGKKPSKVPKGYLAVIVGPKFRRFVIPIRFLSMPEMKNLMDIVAEEFGCDYHADGALHIPCDEDYFSNVLINCYATQRSVSSKKNKIKLGSKIPLINTH
ncbi:unnamed protein product [Lathyrus sativus]|nr:unnamed protein product [Lathyrus sativus]